MKKNRTKKGFTLAELLVVVAIIGVLVAIAIPTFSAQLKKAKQATDLANVRAAYAMCQTAKLTDALEGVPSPVTGKYYLQKGGSMGTVTNAYKTQEGRPSENFAGCPDYKKGNYIVINYDSSKTDPEQKWVLDASES